MAPRWISSSFKHDVSQLDQIRAMAHPSYEVELPGESLDDGRVRLYIGRPHEQTDREIEILVNVYADGRQAIVFHAMPLGPKYRRFREEHPDA